MSKEILDMIDDHIGKLKKDTESVSDSSKPVLGNITRGAEVVRAGFLILDTVSNIVSFFNTRKDHND